MIRARAFFGIAVAIAAVASSAIAAPIVETDVPCRGCVVVRPKAATAPLPLVVVLHGDEGTPSRVQGVWSALVESKQIVVVFPKCPREAGCTAGSFWRWGGAPSWVIDQATAVEQRWSIDPTRRYIAGWSGGTTYIAMHFESWFPYFAAASLTGGGAPGEEACLENAGGACAPTLYRMGDRNPLFSLAESARDRIEACHHAVEWVALAGLDHEGEWTHYTRDAPAIADWLLAHREGCARSSNADPPAPSASASSPPVATAAASPRASGSAPLPTLPLPDPKGARSPTGCQCSLDAIASTSTTTWTEKCAAAALLALAVVSIGRRRASRRDRWTRADAP